MSSNVIIGPWSGRFDSDTCIDLGGNPNTPQSVFIDDKSEKLGKNKYKEDAFVTVYSVLQNEGGTHSVLEYAITPINPTTDNTVLVEQILKYISLLEDNDGNDLSDFEDGVVEGDIKTFNRVLDMIHLYC